MISAPKMAAVLLSMGLLSIFIMSESMSPFQKIAWEAFSFGEQMCEHIESAVAAIWSCKSVWALVMFGLGLVLKKMWNQQFSVSRQQTGAVEGTAEKSAFLEYRMMELMYACSLKSYELRRQAVNFYFEWDMTVEKQWFSRQMLSLHDKWIASGNAFGIEQTENHWLYLVSMVMQTIRKEIDEASEAGWHYVRSKKIHAWAREPVPGPRLCS